MYLLLHLKVSFVARQHLVLQMCYLHIAHCPPPRHLSFSGVNLPVNSLSSCVDPDAYVTLLRFSSIDSSPLLLICLRWEVTFSCAVCARLPVCLCACAGLYTFSFSPCRCTSVSWSHITVHSARVAKRRTCTADKCGYRNVLSCSGFACAPIRGEREGGREGGEGQETRKEHFWYSWL